MFQFLKLHSHEFKMAFLVIEQILVLFPPNRVLIILHLALNLHFLLILFVDKCTTDLV